MYGDTMRYSGKFKEIGGYFNDRLREGAGWIFSKKHELEVRNFIKDKMTDVYTENLSPSNIVVVPAKYELEQSIAVKNIKCTLEGFRTLSMIKIITDEAILHPRSMCIAQLLEVITCGIRS